MSRTRIKICGICRVEDALAAAEAGADAIGMVFHPASPRNVSEALAERVIAALPPFVTPVGLFVDASAKHVAEAAGRLGLRNVQLHGREPPEMLAELAALRPLAILKALRVDRSRLTAELDGWRAAIDHLCLSQLKGFVLETACDGAPGGTGVANDWNAVREFQRRGAFAGLPPLVAAGGLRPQTVAAVVSEIRPWAVDVSSGVEVIRGQKSEELIAAFVAEVRRADAEGETLP